MCSHRGGSIQCVCAAGNCTIFFFFFFFFSFFFLLVLLPALLFLTVSYLIPELLSTAYPPTFRTFSSSFKYNLSFHSAFPYYVMLWQSMLRESAQEVRWRKKVIIGTNLFTQEVNSQENNATTPRWDEQRRKTKLWKWEFSPQQPVFNRRRNRVHIYRTVIQTNVNSEQSSRTTEVWLCIYFLLI